MNQHQTLFHPKYRADIDGLRAIAVLIVVAYHTAPGWLPGGFVGVDIFFVISGYLISLIIFKSLQEKSFSLKNFYIRRIKRIFPATILVLSTFLILGWFLLLPDEYSLLGKHSAAGGAFISNFILWSESGYFDIDSFHKPLLHFWSLGIEEQYYLLWPIIIYLLWKYIREKILVIITITILASFAINVLTINNNSIEAFYSPLTRIWELLIGSSIAYLTLHVELFKNISKEKNNISSSLGIFLIGFCVFIYNDDIAYPGYFALLPIIAASLILLTSPHSSLNIYILGNKALVWFGLISFPLYLWHWPILSFLRIIHEDPSPVLRITAISIAILLSWLTYMYVERPIRYGDTLKKPILTLCASMFFLIISGLTIWGMEGLKDRRSISNSTFTSQIQENFKWEYRSNSFCLNDYPYEDNKNLGHFFCIKNKPEPPTILLLGNSFSNHLYPGFVKNAALEHHSILSIGNHSIENTLSNFDPLSDIQKQKVFIDEIISKTPSLRLVVISGMKGNMSIQQMNTAKERIDFIESRGIQVVIFKPHITSGFLLKQCYTRPLRSARKQCNFDIKTREDIAASFEPFINHISQNNPKTLFIDPNSIYCADTKCSFIHDGLPLLRDKGHYSVYASIEVSNYFVNWAKLYFPEILNTARS